MHTQEHIPPYVYKPLSGRTIRLLHLDPNESFDAPLTGRLEPYTIRELSEDEAFYKIADRQEMYTCFSYVWGSSEKPCTLYLRVPDAAGSNQLQSNPITASLDSLLRRYRSIMSRQLQQDSYKNTHEDNSIIDTNSMIVWADAICINQDDPIEQAHQVAMMHDIYLLAKQVIVDLGEEDSTIAPALDLMAKYWRKMIWGGVVRESKYHGVEERILSPHEAASLYRLPITVEEGVKEKWKKVNLPEPEDPVWNCVEQFWLRPWFTRAWIIQEFVLAKSIVWICGMRNVEYNDLLGSTLGYFDEDGVEVTILLDTLDPKRYKARAILRHFCNLCRTRLTLSRLREDFHGSMEDINSSTPFPEKKWPWWNRITLIHLLDASMLAQSTKRRDKYFALARLALDVDLQFEEDVQPDYLCPVSKVIIAFGKTLWRNFGGEGVESLQGLLGHVGLAVGLTPGVPSWIRDFSRSFDIGPALEREIAARFNNRDPFMYYDAASGTLFHFTLSPGLQHMVTLRGRLVDVLAHEPYPATSNYQRWLPDGAVEIWKPMPVEFAQALEQLAQHIRSTIMASGCLGLDTDLKSVSDQLDSSFFEALSYGSEHIQRRFQDTAELAEVLLDTYELAVQRRALSTVEGTDMDESIKLLLSRLLLPFSSPRKLTRTRRNRITNVPACFERGDEIWIINGVNVPLLLRKSTEYPGCYQLVGHCYLQGMMRGEALRMGLEVQQVTLV
jgi:Heterokaryon incompatibility protein (HET).